MKRRITSFVFALLLAVNIFSSAIPMGTVHAEIAPYKVKVSQYKYAKTVKLKVKKGADISGPINQQITVLRTNRDTINKITRIVIPAGNYKLKEPIQVYGNIMLDCSKNVTIYCKFKMSNMICQATKEYNSDPKLSSGYGSIKNIFILGGTWIGKNSNKSTLMRMSHCKNLTFDGCTFIDGGGKHQVELAAVKNCTIKHCTFQDMAVKSSGSEKCEALQFDAPCHTRIYKETYEDGTPMKNVTVTDCYFKNVPRGIGTHNLLVGAYHTNVEISNNRFENVPQGAIVALGFKNATITGNVISECSAGILVQNFKSGASAVYNTIFDGTVPYNKPFTQNVNCLIANNYIVTSNSSYDGENVAIKVYGCILSSDTKSPRGSTDTIPGGDYRISNVTIVNNTIQSHKHGIHLYGACNTTVSGNTIIGSPNAFFTGHSIWAEGNSTGLIIENNTIKKVGYRGIYINKNSSVNSLKNNSIEPEILGF